MSDRPDSTEPLRHPEWFGWSVVAMGLAVLLLGTALLIGNASLQETAAILATIATWSAAWADTYLGKTRE